MATILEGIKQIDFWRRMKEQRRKYILHRPYHGRSNGNDCKKICFIFLNFVLSILFFNITELF